MKGSSRHSVAEITGLAAIVLCIAGLLLTPQMAQGQSDRQQENMPRDNRPMMGQDCCGSWMGDGPGMDRGMGHGTRRGMPSMIRHRYVMRNGLPSTYRNKVSAFSQSGSTVAEGAALYAANCASCHGTQGYGDGEAGRDLNPPPANIAHMMGMPMYNDPYLFWTISEGGTPVGSAMPEFKEALAEDEIWKIIAAMRAGFPAPARAE